MVLLFTFLKIKESLMNIMLKYRQKLSTDNKVSTGTGKRQVFPDIGSQLFFCFKCRHFTTWIDSHSRYLTLA
jgi:hypothetical protein